MRADIPVVQHNAPLGEVLDAVISTRLNRALIVDEAGRVIGGISDAEILRRLSPKDHPSLGRILISRLPFSAVGPEERRDIERATGTSAADLMFTTVPTVSPETPITEAIATMLGERRKILPVVDAEGRLLGAADRADLLRILLGPAS